MIAFFKQQGVAGIGTFEAISCFEFTIHENSCIGQILSSVQAFAVNICKEMPQGFNFLIKGSISIPVEKFCTVGYIGGAGYFQCRV